MSFINPKIRTTLIIDALLFLIGLAGIYQLAERAGFNPTSYLNLRVSDSHKLVIEKVLSAELDDQFMAGDTLLKVDTYQVSSIDELEVVTDSRRIADLVTWGLLDITWGALSIASAAYFMLIINWKLAIVNNSWNIYCY